MNFKKEAKPQNPDKKQSKKKIFLKIYIHFLRVEKQFLILLIAEYFQQKLRVEVFSDISGYSNVKILTPKQMHQRLPIELAQVKAGNTFENLLNEIRQIMNSLYRRKEITKKLYNKIMNSIKL